MNQNSGLQKLLKKLLVELLDKSLKELTNLLPELFCKDEPYYACNIDSVTYLITFGDAQDLGVVPSHFVLDIGDIVLTLYSGGGYSGGTLLEAKVTNPMDIEVSLDDRDLILDKLRNNITLKDFLRAVYAFTWRLGKNHLLSMTNPKGATIGNLMRDYLSIEIVEPDVILTIKKYYVLNKARYEVGIIRSPLDARIHDTPEIITVAGILDAFKFAFAPLFLYS